MDSAPQVTDAVFVALGDGSRFCVVSSVLGCLPDSTLGQLFPTGLVPFYSLSSLDLDLEEEYLEPHHPHPLHPLFDPLFDPQSPLLKLHAVDEYKLVHVTGLDSAYFSWILHEIRLFLKEKVDAEQCSNDSSRWPETISSDQKTLVKRSDVNTLLLLKEELLFFVIPSSTCGTPKRRASLRQRLSQTFTQHFRKSSASLSSSTTSTTVDLNIIRSKCAKLWQARNSINSNLSCTPTKHFDTVSVEVPLFSSKAINSNQEVDRESLLASWGLDVFSASNSSNVVDGYLTPAPSASPSFVGDKPPESARNYSSNIHRDSQSSAKLELFENSTSEIWNRLGSQDNEKEKEIADLRGNNLEPFTQSRHSILASIKGSHRSLLQSRRSSLLQGPQTNSRSSTVDVGIGMDGKCDSLRWIGKILGEDQSSAGDLLSEDDRPNAEDFISGTTKPVHPDIEFGEIEPMLEVGKADKSPKTPKFQVCHFVEALSRITNLQSNHQWGFRQIQSTGTLVSSVVLDVTPTIKGNQERPDVPRVDTTVSADDKTEVRGDMLITQVKCEGLTTGFDGFSVDALEAHVRLGLPLKKIWWEHEYGRVTKEGHVELGGLGSADGNDEGVFKLWIHKTWSIETVNIL
ncbi:hypothetical protein BDR26DRAFT_924063 [Obelidium mucronatum]|nr:hypothetical protein BDR26DRAFT_924063 [Obelidium mucronatum]